MSFFYSIKLVKSQYEYLVHVLRLLPHHLEELLEVDGAVPVDVELYDQVEDLVLGGVLPYGAEDGKQLLGGDGPAPVL